MTSSSSLGIHFFHYMARRHDAAILKLNALMAQIPYANYILLINGIKYQHYAGKVVSQEMMWPNFTSFIYSRLIFGKTAMAQAKPNGLIAQEQYGGK